MIWPLQISPTIELFDLGYLFMAIVLFIQLSEKETTTPFFSLDSHKSLSKKYSKNTPLTSICVGTFTIIRDFTLYLIIKSHHIIISIHQVRFISFLVVQEILKVWFLSNIILFWLMGKARNGDLVYSMLQITHICIGSFMLQKMLRSLMKWS